MASTTPTAGAKGQPQPSKNASSPAASRIAKLSVEKPAQLVLFDAVFAAVAQRDLAAAERNLSATMGAVKAKRRTP